MHFLFVFSSNLLVHSQLNLNFLRSFTFFSIFRERVRAHTPAFTFLVMVSCAKFLIVMFSEVRKHITNLMHQLKYRCNCLKVSSPRRAIHTHTCLYQIQLYLLDAMSNSIQIDIIYFFLEYIMVWMGLSFQHKMHACLDNWHSPIWLLYNNNKYRMVQLTKCAHRCVCTLYISSSWWFRCGPKFMNIWATRRLHTHTNTNPRAHTHTHHFVQASICEWQCSF